MWNNYIFKNSKCQRFIRKKEKFFKFIKKKLIQKFTYNSKKYKFLKKVRSEKNELSFIKFKKKRIFL